MTAEESIEFAQMQEHAAWQRTFAFFETDVAAAVGPCPGLFRRELRAALMPVLRSYTKVRPRQRSLELDMGGTQGSSMARWLHHRAFSRFYTCWSLASRQPSVAMSSALAS